MTQTLYSLRTDGDQYRITKFTDGDVESSYLCTPTECECPAGVRPSCRHRQMLPQMLAHKLCDTHWFWDFDRGYACDFQGGSKQLADALTRAGEDAPAAGSTMLAEAEGPTAVPKPLEGEILPPIKRTPLPPMKWRRL